ncbi:hypothetical protein Aple_001680 [Acrocarpospora pleiomorpha]|uniref:Uncharacterized protein n=1 Tax=Acrocarpospora pleiomorpha TaxID=90975 RepID=A0A5M3XEC4_9ACTN|nr:hypothetical protein Aple_001680 [Acrocarpospora pleiomorpha]
MFQQPDSQQPAFFSPARVLTPADYGWDEERDHSFRSTASRTSHGQVLAAIARLRRAINPSSHHRA